MSQSSMQQRHDELRLKERAFFWDILLKTYSPQAVRLPNPQTLVQVKLDLAQQRTLHLDIPRTRAQHIPQASHLMMERVITYFCKSERISYKQGINELFGVVSVFTTAGLQWEKVWEYGRQIINTYSNNLYQDEEFLSLQITFSIITLLFKYHDPQLHDYIQHANGLPPELYATPWILTLFAKYSRGQITKRSKMSLEAVLLFWEAYFIEGDRYLILYIVVATLMFYRATLLQVDQSLLPQTITGINITNKEHVQAIFKCALQLRASTPYSIIEFIELSSVFEKYTANVHHEKELLTRLQLKIDKINHIWVSPHECLALLFPNLLSCQNQACDTNPFLKQKRGVCYKCQIKRKQIPAELKRFVGDNIDLQSMIEKQPIAFRFDLVDMRLNRSTGYLQKSINDFGDSTRYYIVMNEDGNYSNDSNLNEWPLQLGLKICLLQGGFKALHDQMLLYGMPIDGHAQCSYCNLKSGKQEEGIWDTFVKLFTDNKTEQCRPTKRPDTKENNMPESVKEPTRFNSNHFFSMDRKVSQASQLPAQLSTAKNKTDQHIHQAIDIIVPVKPERKHSQQGSHRSQLSPKEIPTPSRSDISNRNLILQRPARNETHDQRHSYEMKGLFRTFIGDSDQFSRFLLIIKDNQFKVFNGYHQSSKGSLKQCILFISQDFTIVFKHSHIIFNILSLLQNIKIWHYIGQKAKVSLISTLFVQETVKLNEHMERFVFKIKKFYIMMFLRRISSKLESNLTLSFYFSQPQLVDTICNRSYWFFKIINEFSIKTLDESLRTKRMMAISTESQSISKIELKMSIILENQQDAQLCIEMGKNFYKETQLYLQANATSEQ